THAAAAGVSTLSLHDALPISRGTQRPAAVPPRCSPLSGQVPGLQDRADRSPVTESGREFRVLVHPIRPTWTAAGAPVCAQDRWRSEEHTSELQSRGHLVCRLL